MFLSILLSVFGGPLEKSKNPKNSEILNNKGSHDVWWKNAKIGQNAAYPVFFIHPVYTIGIWTIVGEGGCRD